MKPVIVVEGKSDVQRLENIIDADFVICNGSSISQETINLIKELALVRNVIILTDPDYPGMQIRNKISSQVDNVYHAFVDRSKSSNGKKLGVAECEKEEIIRALKNYVAFSNEQKENVTMQDFIELGLNGNQKAKEKREYISKRFNLGYGNAKTILKRINMLNISLSDLKEALNDCK